MGAYIWAVVDGIAGALKDLLMALFFLMVAGAAYGYTTDSLQFWPNKGWKAYLSVAVLVGFFAWSVADNGRSHLILTRDKIETFSKLIFELLIPAVIGVYFGIKSRCEKQN